MFRSIKRLLGNRKGAFAIQFALMAVPLTVCTGLAIDGGRAFLARFELASALDAAALAAGSTLAEGADLNAVAEKFVEANFRTPHEGPIVLTMTNSDDVLTLKGKVRINTYFMPLVGQPYVDVAAESEVRRGGNNVEVSLALDITQSMSGSKIAALKVAAKDLIEEVVNDSQTPYFSKVAIAPWGTNIHLGSYADAIRGSATGPTAITGAHWRDGTAKNIAANSGWRVGGAGKTISAAAWKNGSAKTISGITKVSSNTRIQVTTSANHGYSNGDFVRITGANGSYTSLNNNIYTVADKANKTFNLKNVAGTAYITPPSGSTNGTAGSSQECYDGECDVRITTSSAHGFAAGNFVRISGVGGMTVLNSGADASWVVEAAPSTTTFTVEGLDGPSVTTTFSGSSGVASECYLATCKYVINATSHGFSSSDYIYISGASVSGSGTDINNAANTSWTTLGSITTNSFQLPGSGYSYKDWTSGGTIAECFLSTCRVRITSAGHGLSAGQRVQILSVGGATGVNNSGSTSWVVDAVQSSSMFSLSSTSPTMSSMSSSYTANTGSAQCLQQGCLKYRFINASNAETIKTISNCATERVGADAHTDVAPSTSPIGRDYAGAGSLVVCNTGNYITPMTSNKTTLNDAIDDMVVNGSTAGQIGAAWAWYMLSPNWSYLWPADENKPKAYGTSELAKVAVLMTDGEFNTAHCNGVTTDAYAYSSVSDSDKISSSECTAAAAPFDQAEDTCDAMKDAGIIVYTVGFELAGEGEAATFMGDCATDSSHAYLADDAEELKAAFKSIATSISKLRISK